MGDQGLIALSEQVLFLRPCTVYYRYVNRATNTFPLHPTATKDVSTDQEFCLGNSVLYPGLEGKFKRSEPYLFGVFRFFTKDVVFKVTLQGRAPRLLPTL